MKYAPHIVGAVAIVAVGGALSGTSIGDSPILTRQHHESLPEAPVLHTTNKALRTTTQAPDHYPLKTPDGTIAVTDLALHGRLRDTHQARYWAEAGDRRRLTAEYDFYETASPERIERERRLLALYEQDAPPSPAQPKQTQSRRPPPAEAPLALEKPSDVAAQPIDGDAKTINVEAELAEIN